MFSDNDEDDEFVDFYEFPQVAEDTDNDEDEVLLAALAEAAYCLLCYCRHRRPTINDQSLGDALA